MTYDATKKPIVKRFTVQEVREKAHKTVRGLQDTLKETEKRMLNITKKIGIEYGVCSTTHLHTFQVSINKLIPWANAIGWNAEMEQAIRRFNAIFHHLYADFREWEKLSPVHCMIAMLQAQQNAS